MATVSVRYIVDDVDAAIDFYCERLGFHEDMHPPTFGVLTPARGPEPRRSSSGPSRPTPATRWVATHQGGPP